MPQILYLARFSVLCRNLRRRAPMERTAVLFSYGSLWHSAERLLKFNSKPADVKLSRARWAVLFKFIIQYFQTGILATPE